MKHYEEFFNGTDNLQLYYQYWLPEDTPRAIVIVVHGFSDHCGRYDELVDGLLQWRLAVYSYDLRGHGQSPGTRGHVQQFDDYRQDTHAFIGLVRDRHPDYPLILFGHSMGGLNALDQAITYPAELSGVIASAPLLGIPPVSPVKVHMGRLLSKVWPSFGMQAGLDESGLSRDEAAVQAYRDDPLVHGRGTARLSTELDKAVIETQANAPNLQVPLLIYFGSDDRLTNPEDGRRFYNNVSGPDKRIVIYDGGHHENHNDIHSERVVIEVAQWIEEQILIGEQEQE